MVGQEEEFDSDEETIVPEIFENKEDLDSDEDVAQSDDELDDLMNSIIDLSLTKSIFDDPSAIYTRSRRHSRAPTIY